MLHCITKCYKVLQNITEYFWRIYLDQFLGLFTLASITSQLVRRCVMNLRSFGNEASVPSISLRPRSLICLGNFRTDNLSSASVLFVIRKNILHFKTIYSIYKDYREIRWKKSPWTLNWTSTNIDVSK